MPKPFTTTAHDEIALPPLRERPEDIGPLINHFLDKLSQEYDRPAPVLDADLMSFTACRVSEMRYRRVTTQLFYIKRDL